MSVVDGGDNYDGDNNDDYYNYNYDYDDDGDGVGDNSNDDNDDDVDGDGDVNGKFDYIDLNYVVISELKKLCRHEEVTIK